MWEFLFKWEGLAKRGNSVKGRMPDFDCLEYKADEALLEQLAKHELIESLFQLCLLPYLTISVQ